jgi:2-haloacid dehalogenase
MLDPKRFTHLSFDCYGTLVDWEAGILAAIRQVLTRHNLTVDDSRILDFYARIEAQEEAGDYKPYAEVLRQVVAGIGVALGFTPTADDLDTLPASVGRWKPFPDTVSALQRLSTRYRLAILSNIDDKLFADTAIRLRVTFDQVITAQQVGRYKPDPANFHFLIRQLGVPKEQILHVAQSLYHDHIPARTLGFSTVWINRQGGKIGVGSVPPKLRPSQEFPDLTSLADFLVC